MRWVWRALMVGSLAAVAWILLLLLDAIRELTVTIRSVMQTFGGG